MTVCYGDLGRYLVNMFPFIIVCPVSLYGMRAQHGGDWAQPPVALIFGEGRAAVFISHSPVLAGSSPLCPFLSGALGEGSKGKQSRLACPVSGCTLLMAGVEDSRDGEGSRAALSRSDTTVSL